MNDITNLSGESGPDEPFIALDKSSYRLEVTRAVWLPYNDTAHDLEVDGRPTWVSRQQNEIAAILSAFTLPAH